MEEIKDNPGNVRRLTEADRTDLADRYASEIEQCLADRSDQEEKWTRWIDDYRGRPLEAKKSYPWEGASNLVIGLAAIYVDSIVARIMKGLFDIEPHWVGTQINATYAPFAKPLEQHLDWARTHVWSQYPVIKSAVLEYCKLGTLILHQGWREDRYFARPSMDLPAVDQGAWKGPWPQWVPRDDFLLPPGYATIEAAPWLAYRQWFSFYDLQAFANQNMFDDHEALAKIKSKEDDEPGLRKTRRSDSGKVMRDARFGLWSPWQVWFREDLDDDGFPEYYKMLLHVNSRTLLRLRPNIYPFGMRPFVKAAFIEQEGDFDGIGVPEMVEQYQAESSTLHNLRIDNGHIANTVMLKVRKGSGITDKDKIYPGKKFLVSDMNDIAPLQLGSNYMSTQAEEQLTISLAERRVGISDVNLGRESTATNRAAATTVMALLQEGTRRFDLNTSELRAALSEQAMQVCELWQTHGLPDVNQPFAPESYLDDEASAKLRTLFSIPDRLRGIVSLKLNVATAAVNREVEKQSNLQLSGVVDQYLLAMTQAAAQLVNPQVPAPIKELIVRTMQAKDTLMQRIFQSHQAYDLDSVLMADVLAGLAYAPPIVPGGNPSPVAAPGLPGGMPPPGMPPMNGAAHA